MERFNSLASVLIFFKQTVNIKRSVYNNNWVLIMGSQFSYRYWITGFVSLFSLLIWYCISIEVTLHPDVSNYFRYCVTSWMFELRHVCVITTHCMLCLRISISADSWVCGGSKVNRHLHTFELLHCTMDTLKRHDTCSIKKVAQLT